MADERLSKKELKELRRLQSLEQKNLEGRQNTMKWIVVATASLLFLAFFGFIIFLAKQKNEKPIPFTNSGWVRGEANAKNQIVEFSDLQCPACRAAEPIVQDILKTDKASVKLLYKHFPLSSHRFSMQVALAAEAAGAQGKFWEMHDTLFDKQSEWSAEAVIDPTDFFVKYATDLKLDIEKFKTDMKDKTLETKIKVEQDEGSAAGVDATPSFYVNGKKVSYDGTKYSIERELR